VLYTPYSFSRRGTTGRLCIASFALLQLLSSSLRMGERCADCFLIADALSTSWAARVCMERCQECCTHHLLLCRQSRGHTSKALSSSLRVIVTNKARCPAHSEECGYRPGQKSVAMDEEPQQHWSCERGQAHSTKLKDCDNLPVQSF
jgi:hypothetical protein